VFARIVIANDGSEGGFKALALGCDLVRLAPCPVLVAK
jgi:nucleotide-binding universal stress UspA family protein